MKHESHPHELYAATMFNENPKIPCFSCKLPTFGKCYACTKCNYYHLHQFCFDLPESKNLQSHHRHTLSLIFDTSSQQTNCDACGGSCDGFTYNCSSCSFNLHANCASLLSSRNQHIAAFSKHNLAEMKSLRSQVGSSRGELETLRREMGLCKAELESLRRKLGSSNSELESTRSEMGSLKNEMRSLVGKLESMSVEMKNDRAEEERRRLEDMEFALERKKHQVHMQQINRINESITRLGNIGTSSSYEYRYYY